MTKAFGRVLSVVLAVVLLLCAFAAGPAVAAPVRVLFIGNELIDVPAIPQRLADLAKAMGKEVEIEAAAFDSYTLEDHLRDDRTLALLGKGWNVVVLQQGPSASPDERESGKACAVADSAPRLAGSGRWRWLPGRERARPKDHR